MTVAQIDPLSEPPSRADPDNFPERSDTFLAEIGPFALQANALALQVNGFAVDAAAAADSAAAALAAAADSAAAALASENAAADSAAESEASAIQASKLNLGPKSVAPVVDNQGDPLLRGATYYDIVLKKWLVWAGTGWTEGLSVTAGVSSFNGQVGAVTGVSSVNGETGDIIFTGVPDFVLMNLGVI